MGGKAGDRPVGGPFTTSGGYATQFLDPVPLDELPPDDDPEHRDILLPTEGESLLDTGDFVFLAEFMAFIRGSKIMNNGDLIITVGVPYEYKYEAMPLTDLRGLVFVLQAHRPKGRVENNGG